MLEDDFHAEWLREFDTAEAAIEQRRRLEAMTAAQPVARDWTDVLRRPVRYPRLHVSEETGKEIAPAKPR